MALAAIPATPVQGQTTGSIQVVAQVDTSEHIYAGRRFTYSILIDGYNGPGQVDLAPLAAYSPQSAGNQDVSQTSISMANGKTSRQEVKRFVMNYSLLAAAAGTVTLPPVTVQVEGKAYQTEPIQIEVLTPGTTNKLALEVDLADKRCYVGQPVLITVNLYVSADAGVGGLEFNIPALTDDRFYLEDPQTPGPQAKQARIMGGVAAYVTQTQVSRQGRPWIRVSFSKILIPKQAGQIDLGDSTVGAALAVGRQQSRDPFGDFGFFGSRTQYSQFAITSPAISLTILPLPEQGKPAGFYGLVGRYTIASSASPTEVSVGDPITLTIRIGGNPYLKPVQWPALDQVPALAAGFKLPSEQASPTIENGSKVFVQTLRANSDKVTQIPPIPLVYFDPDKGQYVTSLTDPVGLKVGASKVLTGVDVGGRSSEPVNREVEAIKQGLAANYEDVQALVDQERSSLAILGQPLVLALWLGPLLALLASGVFKAATYTTPERQMQRRRRRAATLAIQKLEAVTATGPDDRHKLLGAGLRQYLGDRFDRPAGSLTAADGHQIVLQATADNDLASRLQAILAECEAAHYASGQASIGADRVTEAVDLVRQIDRRAG
jgi:hypothetical protein